MKYGSRPIHENRKVLQGSDACSSFRLQQVWPSIIPQHDLGFPDHGPPRRRPCGKAQQGLSSPSIVQVWTIFLWRGESSLVVKIDLAVRLSRAKLRTMDKESPPSVLTFKMDQLGGMEGSLLLARHLRFAAAEGHFTPSRVQTCPMRVTQPITRF